MLHGPNEPSIASVQHMRFEDNLYANPIAALWSGTFAVAIFFVLSGFVLSIGYFQTGKVDILKKIAAKRYFRLMIPALVSILICYALIALSLSSMQSAAAIIQSDQLAKAWDFTPSIMTALYDGTVGVFIGGANSYNPVLWTMAVEFLGSFMVFATLLLFSDSRYRALVYAVLLIALFNTWFMAFIIGMIFADIYTKKRITAGKRKWYVLVSVLAISLYLGGYPYGEDLSHTLYAPFSIFSGLNIDMRMLSLTAAATLLVVGVLTIVQVANVLQRKPIRLLGKYSFSLYLVHLPILWIVTTQIFVWFSDLLGYNAAVVASLVLTIPIVWLATLTFAKFVDFKAVAFSSYFADVYMGKRSFVPKQALYRLRVATKAMSGITLRRFSLMRRPVLDNEVD